MIQRYIVVWLFDMERIVSPNPTAALLYEVFLGERLRAYARTALPRPLNAPGAPLGSGSGKTRKRDLLDGAGKHKRA